MKNLLMITIILLTSACGDNGLDNLNGKSGLRKSSLSGYFNDFFEKYDCDLRVYYSAIGNRVLICRGLKFYEDEPSNDEETTVLVEEQYQLSMDFSENMMDDLEALSISSEISDKHLEYPFVGFPNEAVFYEMIDEDSQIRFIVDQSYTYDNPNAENALGNPGYILIEFKDSKLVKIIDEARNANPFYN